MDNEPKSVSLSNVMNRFLYAFFLLLVVVCPGSASFSREITGRVISDAKVPEPIADVRVGVLEKGRVICETRTDLKGVYAIKADRDTFDLVFDHAGYAGVIVTGLSIREKGLRVPDTRLTPLMKECRALGISPVVNNETEIYSAFLSGEIFAHKLVAIREQFPSEYQQMLGNTDPAGDFTILTAAGRAISRDDRKLLELLLAQGMSVNAVDGEGSTLLHMAVYQGNRSLSELLISRGSDVNARDRNGRTPLHIASQNRNKELILLLLSKGAYPFEADDSGIMPLAGSQAADASEAERPFRIREGYALPVTSLCFSPSGRFLVSGSEDGITRVWSPASGRLLAELGASRGPVTSLCVSPAGSHLVSCYRDGSAVVWDWRDEKIGEHVISCSSPVNALAFSSEGKYLITGSADGTLRVWNALSHKLTGTYPAHSRAVTALSLLPGGSCIASSGDDGTVQLTDFHGRRKSGVLFRHSRAIRAFCLSPGGTGYALGDESGEILLVDFLTGRVIARFTGHEGPVTGLTYSPGGRYLVSAGRDGVINYWDSLTWTRRQSCTAGGGAIKAIRFSPGGRFLVAGNEDGSITIADSLSGAVTATLVGLRDSEWISVTSDLFFDSSLGAARNILLRSKGGYVTLDQYATPRRSPNKLKESISGTTMPLRALSLPEPPRIRIASPAEGAESESGTATLKVEVQGNCRVEEFQVLVNGRPAVRDVSEDEGAQGKVREFELTAQLQPGLNKVEVVAVSADEVKSHPAALGVTYRYPGPVPSRRLFLLAVGVSNYGDTNLNLDSAAIDAREVVEFFGRMKGLLFEEVKSVKLIDADAGSNRIIDAIREIGRRSTDRDLVIIFLAGHGVRDLKDQFFFLCHGGRRSELPARALSWIDFRQALLSLRAGNVLLLLDACHSGSLFRPEEEFVTHDNLAEGMTGITVYAACRGNESSSEFPKLGGVFTQSFLSGLHGSACSAGSRDGRITLFQAERYVSDLVPRITGNRQHPVILERERVTDIPLSVIKVAQ